MYCPPCSEHATSDSGDSSGEDHRRHPGRGHYFGTSSSQHRSFLVGDVDYYARALAGAPVRTFDFEEFSFHNNNNAPRACNSSHNRRPRRGDDNQSQTSEALSRAEQIIAHLEGPSASRAAECPSALPTRTTSSDDGGSDDSKSAGMDADGRRWTNSNTNDNSNSNCNCNRADEGIDRPLATSSLSPHPPRRPPSPGETLFEYDARNQFTRGNPEDDRFFRDPRGSPMPPRGHDHDHHYDDDNDLDEGYVPRQRIGGHGLGDRDLAPPRFVNRNPSQSSISTSGFLSFYSEAFTFRGEPSVPGHVYDAPQPSPSWNEDQRNYYENEDYHRPHSINDQGYGNALYPDDTRRSSDHRYWDDGRRSPLPSPPRSSSGGNNYPSQGSSPRLPPAEHHSRTFNNHHRPLLEVAPGLYMRLVGTDETMKAIQEGNITVTSCVCCSMDIHCSMEVKFVLCPDCRVVSPVDQSDCDAILEPQHGALIGLGVKTGMLLTLMEGR